MIIPRRSFIKFTGVVTAWLTLPKAIRRLPHDKNLVKSGGHTIFVSPDGMDRYDGLSPRAAKRTITNALQQAMPCDTVFVMAGDYYEEVTPVVNCKLIMHGSHIKIESGDCYVNFGPGARDCIITSCYFYGLE